ncbi:ATP-binding cassette domain-containing protein [Flavimarina sp. Hel_I_48]|uniref:ATP-binding cassette domain-containing protein n=1 Tax=Flavimarina sp. Hel_I_48 TaxID=1392488 RepID=UPI0006912EAD|nr:ATP-binding cassette domain-containing protein [Flavimarina sp. Hel_I_48]
MSNTNSSKIHLGLLLSDSVNKKGLIAKLFSHEKKAILQKFCDGKGLIFSDFVIEKIHEEERRYDECLIAYRKLATYSSGERKKLFIEHILKQNPDFIVLDNPLDHLDQESRVVFSKTLEEISRKTTLIQLASRAADFLGFIDQKFKLSGEKFDLIPLSAELEKDQKVSKNHLNLPENSSKTRKTKDELVKMKQISVSYDGKPIVKDISWTIFQGDFWQLIGPNGSGKSTILSLITGESTKGYGQELYLFGKKKGSGESIWEIKQQIGYFAPNMIELFQRNNTLKEMILSGFYDSVGLYDKPSTFQQNKALQWLQLAKMENLKNHNFNKLSPGQQRLGLILRAVVKNPSLLILDEPTEGLDDIAAGLVIELITTFRSQTAMAIVFVSHRVEKGLEPRAVLELLPSTEGSISKVTSSNNNKV